MKTALAAAITTLLATNVFFFLLYKNEKVSTKYLNSLLTANVVPQNGLKVYLVDDKRGLLMEGRVERFDIDFGYRKVSGQEWERTGTSLIILHTVNNTPAEARIW